MRSGPQIYVKGSLEAAALYVEAFNLRIDPEITFFNPDGTYSHASLMSGEDGILAIAEDKDDRHSDRIVGDKAPVMPFNV